MPSIPCHQEQLEFVANLAENRIGFLNPFFEFLNYFDSAYFFFALIPFIWLGFSYRWGLRIFYWFTLNSLINGLAKTVIGWPRPSTEFPSLGMFHPHSYGFPSGGAQICMFLGGILIYYGKTRAAWITGLIYILLISFSRLYLGVHYPIDILGGWLIAWILLLFFIVTKEPIDRLLAKVELKTCLFLSLAIPIALALIAQNGHVTYVTGSLVGVGIGTYVSLKHHLFLPKPKNLMEGVGRAVIGIAILFLLVFLWPTSFPRVTQSFVGGLFMSIAASPICKWFMGRKLS